MAHLIKALADMSRAHRQAPRRRRRAGAGGVQGARQVAGGGRARPAELQPLPRRVPRRPEEHDRRGPHARGVLHGLRRRGAASTSSSTSKEIDERLKNGPEMVSAKFVIPYPPGFPIMVPGQVITPETIAFMRKLDVKEIHGFNAALGPRAAQARGARRAARAGSDRQPPKRPKGSDAMKAIFNWFAANPFILLFFVVGGAVLRRQGHASRATAWAWWPRPSSSAPALSAWASTYGVKMELDNFTKSLFYYLFMYGVGLRVGPSFINSLKGDGLKFTVLAVFCSILGPARRGVLHQAVGPAGRRGGRHPRRLDDHVGGDRLGRGGGAPGRVQARGRADRRAGERHDRALLRPDLHLGHGRHHPDLQVPAALVGHRCQGGGARSTRRSTACRTSTTPASPATGRWRCAPTG